MEVNKDSDVNLENFKKGLSERKNWNILEWG